MVKNFLNNPWFVVVLCVVATVYLGFVVGKPLLEGNVQAAELSADLPPLEIDAEDDSFDRVGSSTISQVNGLNSHELGARSKITWLEDIQRDPFASSIVQAEPQQAAGWGARDGVAKPARPSLPALSAVFVGRGISAAVLDDRLLNVGDKIRGYTVARIEKNQVTLALGPRTFLLEPGV